jgi:L-asparaginase
MVSSPDGLRPGADVEAEIVAALGSAVSERVADGLEGKNLAETDFVAFERVIDSADANPADWQRIIDHVGLNQDRFDGFVILHGTDTLAYAAAASAFALTHVSKPVVFTGAQLPFSVAGSDAPDNVIGALRAATSGTLRSAVVYFGGELLAAARVTKVSTLDRRGFGSPNWPPVTSESAPDQWPSSQLPPAGVGWDDAAPYGSHDVAVITMVPGLTVARFRTMTSPPPDAVILRAYGMGEAPTEDAGFEEVIRDLIHRGTPVVVGSQCLRARIELDRYAAGKGLRRAGAIGAGDMTFESIYAKVQFLLSQSVALDTFGRWIHTNIAGELAAEIDKAGEWDANAGVRISPRAP